ncbi:hypothetical protein SAMN05660691_00195 [Rheinheimera pacifica]|uniref:Restriction endonuclease n=1 Tax=Rheinheimera pacifica TaxID=173990 RepID=A0A1H6J8G3_9GAMM|nr:hypothetical protein [Rheinheimera pacifica]SEH56673.1 hypothetical protein SAMN05660691_00195 [Rheinheimera pacifica]
MKLNHILSVLNQIEKSKFITCLDKLCSSAATNDEVISKALNKVNRQIKDASGSEITQLFNAVSAQYQYSIREKLALCDASMALLVNILTRDGNGIARISWIEQLYAREWETLDTLARQIQVDIESNLAEDYGHAHRLKIFRDCLNIAYKNDEKINRQANITDDERSILNVLAHHLKISHDELVAIEHLSEPIKAGKQTVDNCLQELRDMGVIFINRKSSEVLIPDEVVAVLNQIQGKELADKHLLRILRVLSDAELSNILKSYGKRIRGVSRGEKISTILHSGIAVRDMLSRDLYDDADNQNKRKERLKQLIADLDIDAERIGFTLDERIDVILASLNTAADREFDAISATGYKEMFDSLVQNFQGLDAAGNPETLTQRIRQEYELEENEEINVERLRALSITPHDVLYLLTNDEVKELRDNLKLPKKGNPRSNILEAFANANDKLIENYAALAKRDLLTLKAVGIEINETDVGVKFEEATKTILEQLDLVVDEELRKSINTSKDKADIIISISDDDIIIGEAKTCKNGDFAKYSTTSRQIKAYVNRCENQGKRVAQVLIIAPSFSQDFIESAEMDTEVNISLLTAEGLKQIYDAYKAKRRPNFSAKLLTKGGLLKAELIAKSI